MSEPLTLELLDKDGAMRDALDEKSQGTRADLFRRAVIGGGSVLAGGVPIGGLPQVALGRKSAKQDAHDPQLRPAPGVPGVGVLRRRREAGRALRRPRSPFATTVPRPRARARPGAPGARSAARRSPSRRLTSRARQQAPASSSRPRSCSRTRASPPTTARARACGARRSPTAASIVSVEARHAAWIRHIAAGLDYPAGKATLPAPVAFDPALSKKQVTAAVGATGFITG